MFNVATYQEDISVLKAKNLCKIMPIEMRAH